MSENNVSEKQAYKQACSEYYAVKEEAATMDSIVRQEAQSYDAKPHRSWTEIGLNLEQEAISSSAQIIKEREEL